MFAPTMAEREISIDDFPIPGQLNPIVLRQEQASPSEVPSTGVPILEQLLHCSSTTPSEYHEIIAEEAIKHGIHHGMETGKRKPKPVCVQSIYSGLKGGQDSPPARYSTERIAPPRSEARRSEEQITCTDFLRESYPPSLIDTSQSSSSDESSQSGMRSLDLAQARELRNSSSTLTPSRQRWRLSSHRSSQGGKDYQSKAVDSTKLYRKLRENLSLRSYTTRSSRSNSNSSSQETLHSLQKCAERNLTAVNLQQLHISDPQYSRSTLEFCEEKISTWPCRTAQQRYLLNQLLLTPQEIEDLETHHHFEADAADTDPDDEERRRRQLSRFSWSTIQTTGDDYQKELPSWPKKLFKRPGARGKIPEWLTGYD